MFKDFKLDFADFSDFKIDLGQSFKSRYIKPPLTKEISEVNLKYSDAKKLADSIDLKKNERIFCIINGSFIFGDFIEALVVKNNWHIKSMTISTLSMSENNVDSLANLINGGFVNELNLIVSDYFYSHERSNIIPYIYQELDKENKLQLAVAGTHCKVCIFETYNNGFVVIHGSANLRSSQNIEQFVVEESETLYRFNKEYQDSIIKKFKTINKAIRGKELWHQVQADTQI
jgi:hypothetical protein